MYELQKLLQRDKFSPAILEWFKQMIICLGVSNDSHRLCTMLVWGPSHHVRASEEFLLWSTPHEVKLPSGR